MMQVFLYIFYFFLFSAVLYFLQSRNQFISKNSLFWAGWILKVSAGILLTSIYTYHYKNLNENDIYKYFGDGEKIYEILHENPVDYVKILFGIGNDNPEFTQKYYSRLDWWDRKYSSDLFNDSHLIIRFNAFVRIFSMGSIYIHTLFMNVLSFLGLLYFVKSLKYVFAIGRFSEILLLFWPSNLFWSSGLLKEAIVWAGIGSMMAGYFLFKQNFLKIIFSILGFLLIYFSKFYIAAFFLIMVAFLWTTVQYSVKQRLWLVYFVIAPVLIYVVADTMAFMLDLSGVKDFIIRQRNDFVTLAIQTKAKSTIDYVTFNSTLDLLAYLPKAFYHSLFYPFPFDAHNLFMLFYSMENIMMLVLIVSAIFIFIKYKSAIEPFLSFKQISLFYFCLAYSLGLLLVIGLTTPVAGAIFRYRSVILPFLLIPAAEILNYWLVSKKHKKYYEKFKEMDL